MYMSFSFPCFHIVLSSPLSYFTTNVSLDQSALLLIIQATRSPVERYEISTKYLMLKAVDQILPETDRSFLVHSL
jgi:hypothetical protein